MGRFQVARPEDADLPLVIFVNHASWWDPLVCLLLQNLLFPGRRAFAPIDAAALARYRFFSRLGFFGVEQNSRRGALQFLRAAGAVLQQPDTVLWLTPQGHFCDVRERPLRFKDGLGHLASRVERAVFLPLAIEYVFWEERCPEVLARFGDPVRVEDTLAAGRAPAWWTSLFEQRLEHAQDGLAMIARRRTSEDFRILLRGGSGVGFFYDVWRRLCARFRGEDFKPEHGQL